MNKQGTGLSLNERGQSLVDAVYRAIGYRQSMLDGLWLAPRGVERREVQLQTSGGSC